MHSTFSAYFAVTEFKTHTGYEFHPTVAGQLLARRRVGKIGIDEFSKAIYSSDFWERLWTDMTDLANNRCRYEPTATPPKPCAPPSLILAVENSTAKA